MRQQPIRVQHPGLRIDVGEKTPVAAQLRGEGGRHERECRDDRERPFRRGATRNGQDGSDQGDVPDDARATPPSGRPRRRQSLASSSRASGP